MLFAKRTAQVLESWAVLHSFHMMHHRLLIAVFKEAYKEKLSEPQGNNPHIRELRTARNRVWWDQRREIPTHLKDATEHHAAPGNVSEWEDPLVLAYGNNWRKFRDGLPDKAAWMTHCGNFVSLICEKWGLPKPKITDVSSSGDGHCGVMREAKRLKVITSLDGRPRVHDTLDVEPLIVEWARSHGCFMFVVDCQPLAEVVNGRAPLHAAELEDCLEQTLRDIEIILDCGWIPSGLWTDPIKWAPRAHNIVADYLCNYSMDHCTTWSHVFNDELPKEFNMLMHSDGGRGTAADQRRG
jgi:hypothetical protein